MLKSMRIGDEAEKEVIDYLTTIGMYACKNGDKNERLYYDIIGVNTDDSIYVTFEVKNDVMSHKTGNVAIEYFNSKKKTPSGITATKADWWIHKICGELWIVRVSDLLDFTNRVRPHKMISSGGDNNADLMIYRVDDFTDVCRRLDSILEPKELTS